MKVSIHVSADGYHFTWDGKSRSADWEEAGEAMKEILEEFGVKVKLTKG